MRWLFVAVLLLPHSANAGAWLMEAGEGRQVIANFTYYEANQGFDAEGVRQERAKFSKYEFNPYIEYGLLENLTIGGSFAAKSANDEASGENNMNIDDINIFGRSYLYQGSILGYDGFVISAEPAVYIPISSDSGDMNQQTGISPSIKLNLGYGAEKYFADISAGYAYRSGDQADKILSDVTYGYRIVEDWLVLNQLFATTMIDADYTKSSDYDLAKAQTSVVWDYNEKFSHQIGASYDVYGRNTGAGFGILYSLWYRF